MSMVVIAPLVLGGCGLGIFANRATNPVIEDDITGFAGSERTKIYSLVSMNAGRRMVLTPVLPDARTGRHFTCAEPPPDAIEAVSDSLRAEGAGSGASPARVEFERGFAVSSGALLYRSQGLQMLRDGLAHLCNMRMNGVITDAEYLGELRAFRGAAERAIIAEVPAVIEAAKRPPLTVVAPAAPGRAATP
jgi:hypothetical protein